jgi:hypothetical protein
MAGRTIAIAAPPLGSFAPPAVLVLPVAPVNAHVPIVQRAAWQERGPPVSPRVSLV